MRPERKQQYESHQEGSKCTNVDISSLKQFALRLPSSSTLRSVLLGEKDTMTVEEFLAKMETWDNIASLESK
jgi:hypothetical protein